MALSFRSLDDQSYESILEQAKSRLPWLCPAWTDHNSHDPGITILELMAWYKELQQYYMNQMTPAVQKALLKLAGVTPEGPHAAECMIEAEPDGPARLADSRLKSPQGIPFELPEPIPSLRTRLASVRIEQDGKLYDVDVLNNSEVVFHPFFFRNGVYTGSAPNRSGASASPNGRPASGSVSSAASGSASDLSSGSVSGSASGPLAPEAGESSLRLGFSGKPRGELRLWFDVVEPEGSRRNPPDADSLPPRALVWEAESGAGPVSVEVLRDDTWHLSWSGYVTLSAPTEWNAGTDGLYWLTVRQTAAGCEEEVRLVSVSANRFRCIQQESRVRRYGFHVRSGFGQEVLIPSAQAEYAYLAVFRRTAGGWEQAEHVLDAVFQEGRLVRLDTDGCVQDGEDNLLVVSQNTLSPMLYDLKGLPGERLFLDLGRKTALELELICQTLMEDGTVRPALWRRVDTLSVCGPRDRAFVWDSAQEEVVFGDGLHGAVPEAGEGTVLIASLILSECGGGNLPAGAGLTFTGDGTRVENGAASGGADEETLPEARNRLLRKLNDTNKCQSASDYARCALRTPGVRLAEARAIPGYDPAMGADRRHTGYVSVLVLPASEAARPMPDERLLTAVDRQLERSRSVCVQAKAIAPRYVPLSVSIRALVQPGVRREAVEAVLRDWLRPRAALAGELVRRSDAMALLQKVDGVLQVYSADFRPLDSGGYLTPTGDLRLPPDGLPTLEAVEMELTEI